MKLIVSKIVPFDLCWARSLLYLNSLFIEIITMDKSAVADKD